MIRMRPARRHSRRPLLVAMTAWAVAFVVPAAVSAHQLTGRYESPLPLAAYLGGAAVAVGLSFAFVVMRSSPAAAAAARAETDAALAPSQPIRVPRVLRVGLQVVGMAGWLLVVVQSVVSGSGNDADAPSLILWTFGWVGLALISALIGPIWHWLDPFTTIYDLLAGLARRLGIRGGAAAPYPARLDLWPAVIGYGVFVWFELVLLVARGGRPLAAILVGYTVLTLVMMAQFGRDNWRAKGEVFGVWFATLGRIAPLALVHSGGLDEKPDDDVVRQRRFGFGLLEPGWTLARLVLVAIATAGILFDGLSQTEFWFNLFGVPATPAATVQLIVFLGLITLAVLWVARIIGIAAMGAGLLPIALGYLIAHYFTALVFDGQRIMVVLSDPLQLGWNLFGTANFEPNDTFLPGGVVWAIELVAVVGGHVMGAIFGHRAVMLGRADASAGVVAQVVAAPAPGSAGSAGPRGSSGRRRGATRAAGGRSPTATTATGARSGPDSWGATASSASVREMQLRQVPLAILMVVLTALTLWSLGQGLVHETASTGEPVGAIVTTSPAART